MALDPATFVKVGVALYGETWQVSVAKDLNVNLRTIARWRRGEFQIPDGIIKELAELCRNRGGRLLKMADKLEQE